jgi:hypothetical protein
MRKGFVEMSGSLITTYVNGGCSHSSGDNNDNNKDATSPFPPSVPGIGIALPKTVKNRG